MLQSAELLEPEPDTQIFAQGDPIDHYFFLLRGLVGLHKRKREGTDDSGDVHLIYAGKIIG